jgi:hypothetical protein
MKETLTAEKLAEQNMVCRNFVKQIVDFGVTERQKLLLIKLFALELERFDHMQMFCDTLREIEENGTKIAISSDVQEEQVKILGV